MCKHAPLMQVLMGASRRHCYVAYLPPTCMHYFLYVTHVYIQVNPSMACRSDNIQSTKDLCTALMASNVENK